MRFQRGMPLCWFRFVLGSGFDSICLRSQTSIRFGSSSVRAPFGSSLWSVTFDNKMKPQQATDKT